jgi:hypothetical protein
MNTTDVIPLIFDPSPGHYKKQAAALVDTCRSIHHDSVKHIRKYHPEPERFTQLNRPDVNFGPDDARLVVAREHGFVDWPALLQHIADLKEPPSPVAGKCREDFAGKSVKKKNPSLGNPSG